MQMACGPLVSIRTCGPTLLTVASVSGVLGPPTRRDDGTDFALNRGAVFGALLALEEEAVNERLAALRLVLSALEIEAVGRAVGPQSGPRVLAFVRDWLDLAADGPLHQERLALRAIVEGEVCAQAA